VRDPAHQLRGHVPAAVGMGVRAALLTDR
jgi:hypothetical protein